MNIAGILEEQARRAGDRPAIVESGLTISFAELDWASAAAAADLARAGVRAGMRVLVFSPMSIGLYTTLVALFRLRATAVFVDPSVGRRHLAACVSRVRPGAFVAVPRGHWLRLASAAIRSIPIKAAIGARIPGAASIARRTAGAGRPVEPCDPGTPAIITFTSGSTGVPKAVVRTHGLLVAQHRALEECLALTPGDVDLCTMPIVLLANLASGLTSVIPGADLRFPGAIDPAPVDAQIRATGVSRTVASPALLDRLAAHASRTGRPLDTLRRIHTGGAPVFPSLIDRLAAAAPQASIVCVYGSTEAEPIAALDFREIAAEDRRAMAAGSGLLAGCIRPSIELRIIADRWGTPVGPLTDGDFDRLALEPGAAGEIVVTGNHVVRGYLDGQGDEETKIRVADRVWHRTGDAGCLDGAGRLWLLGRCSARAADSHGVLYPFAVECAASVVGGVRRSAFSVHGGRRLLAVEIEGDGARVRQDLLDRLSWARLADVVAVPRIPVDARHNAKVEYAALRGLLERRRP